MPSAAPPPAARALRRLRTTATLVVAAFLLARGGGGLLRTDPVVTMTGRYLDNVPVRRAGGCMEMALALWLASGRSPRLAPCVAAGAFAGVGLLIAGELRRDRPLPSGTGPLPAVALAIPAARAELAVALGREAFLLALCLLAAALPDEAAATTATPSRSAFDRYA